MCFRWEEVRGQNSENVDCMHPNLPTFRKIKIYLSENVITSLSSFHYQSQRVVISEYMQHDVLNVVVLLNKHRDNIHFQG